MSEPEWEWHCMTCRKDVKVNIESYIAFVSPFDRFVIVDVDVSCHECKASLASASQRVVLST